MLAKILIAILVVVPAVALAGGKQDDRLRRLDADGNGMISRAEAKKDATLATDFDAIDVNRDGQLTPDEMRAWRKTSSGARRAQGETRFEEHFSRADSNSDGALTHAEAERGMPRLARHFDAVDANRDGKVNLDELRAYMRAKHAVKAR